MDKKQLALFVPHKLWSTIFSRLFAALCAFESYMKIPEIKLVIHPETDEAKSAVGYKYNDEAGTRHKLGGSPDYLQDEEWPECCGKQMTFYAQIDSIGDDYDLADCGMVYVFVCFDCFETKSILQAF